MVGMENLFRSELTALFFIHSHGIIDNISADIFQGILISDDVFVIIALP